VAALSFFYTLSSVPELQILPGSWGTPA